MKIQSLHFADLGPLGTQDIDLLNTWTGEIETNVLFTGPNGCGKSTLLRTVVMLWEAAGFWLENDRAMPETHPAAKYLSRWGSAAIILADMAIDPRQKITVGLVFRKHGQLEFVNQRSDVLWLGETHFQGAESGKGGTFISTNSDCMETWAIARQRMSLEFASFGLPNILFMDAEERRWVVPTQRIGEIAAESPEIRWAPRYISSEDWRGQLESSLINLKLTDEKRFDAVLIELNAFLINKKIAGDIKRGENRLRVRLSHPGKAEEQFHTLDELSAGERQVLIMLYVIARWAEKGCVVMIDEPDLYLHPSLINGMLSRLAGMVNDLDGQLLITSHLPAVWDRYEGVARRIELGDLGE